MKSRLIILLGFLWIGVSAQISVPNFNNIQKGISDPESMFFYDRILYKFKGLPTILNQEEAQHLYYARQLKGDLVSTSDEDFLEMVDLLKKGNRDETINRSLKLLSKDPTNLDLLMVIIQVYRAKGDDANFMFRLNQFRLLVEAIKSSGDGKSKNTPYIVNSVGDEYILLSVLNIDIDAYKRTSLNAKDGMIDVWTKDQTQIFIKVVFPKNKL